MKNLFLLAKAGTLRKTGLNDTELFTILSKEDNGYSSEEINSAISKMPLYENYLKAKKYRILIYAMIALAISSSLMWHFIVMQKISIPLLPAFFLFAMLVHYKTILSNTIAFWFIVITFFLAVSKILLLPLPFLFAAILLQIFQIKKLFPGVNFVTGKALK